MLQALVFSEGKLVSTVGKLVSTAGKLVSEFSVVRVCGWMLELVLLAEDCKVISANHVKEQ